MNEPAPIDYRSFIIPYSIMTRADIARLVREFERVDNDLTASGAKMHVGLGDDSSVALSPQLADFLSQNKLQPRNGTERTALIKQLRLLKTAIPVVHMTFATEADEETLKYLVQWLRQSVHAQSVLVVGLQPNLVAGVYIRTQNRVYDFSLRTRLQTQRSVLTSALESIRASV